MVTVADIFRQIPPQLLDTVVSDQHVVLIAKDMVEWEPCASILGLTQAEQKEIRANHPGDYGLQKQTMLFKWKQAQAFNAKYRILFITFCSLGMSDLAYKLKQLLLHVPKESASRKSVLENFRLYLQECYTSVTHPSKTQWPFSALQSYVDLSLFDAPLSDDLLTNSEEQEKQSLTEIKLESLFLAGNRQAKRRVLLLEGVAGSGKTTLSWHSCKKWAAGELFQHIKLLIHVSLNNPEIASVKSLADIIPHPDEGMRVAVAKAIADERGNGVCFYFDACDENPEAFQQGFLSDFIKGKGRAMLPCCSIVMAARPEIHLKVPLSPLLTARVFIRGFDLSKLEEFIESSLRADDKLKSQIAESFELNPELVGLCSLPLNAVILIHLFRLNPIKNSQLNTQTSLFKLMVCNLLIRHVNSTTNELLSIQNFSDLPQTYRKKFNTVCSLAFSAYINQKRLIGEGVIKAHKLSSSVDTFGLMRSHQQLVTRCGPSRYYSFLHLSIQEFLAAVYISQLSEDKQVENVQQILQTTPRSPVLPFYAGLTKLTNRATLDELLKIVKKPLGLHFSKLDFQSLLTALLNCICEAQIPELCEHVKQVYSSEKHGIKFSRLSFVGPLLSPLNYLSIGYFLGNVSQTLIDLNVLSCNDMGLNVMFKQLRAQKLLKGLPPTNGLNLSFHNTISAETAKLLKDVYKYVYHFSLLTGDHMTSAVLKNVLEGTYDCIDQRSLMIGSVKPNPASLHYYVLLLICPNLFGLSLRDVEINQMLIGAIKVSTLSGLRLLGCKIGNYYLHCLGSAVCDHKYLQLLDIRENCYSSDAVTSFLRQLLTGNNSVLDTLFIQSDSFVVTDSVDSEQKHMLNTINIKRKNFLKPILRLITNPVSEIPPDSSILHFSKSSRERRIPVYT